MIPPPKKKKKEEKTLSFRLVMFGVTEEQPRRTVQQAIRNKGSPRSNVEHVLGLRGINPGIN